MQGDQTQLLLFLAVVIGLGVVFAMTIHHPALFVLVFAIAIGGTLSLVLRRQHRIRRVTLEAEGLRLEPGGILKGRRTRFLPWKKIQAIHLRRWVPSGTGIGPPSLLERVEIRAAATRYHFVTTPNPKDPDRLRLLLEDRAGSGVVLRSGDGEAP